MYTKALANMSTNIQQTVGQLLADCQPIVGGPLVDALANTEFITFPLCLNINLPNTTYKRTRKWDCVTNKKKIIVSFSAFSVSAIVHQVIICTK